MMLLTAIHIYENVSEVDPFISTVSQWHWGLLSIKQK